MKYEGLEKIFYQDKQRHEEIYQQRWNSEYAIHLDFEVAGHPAFFMQTPEIFAMLAQILRMNKAVSDLCQRLPGAALHQFSRQCLIDEIVLTNSIEGVRSTRKEISDILDELDKKCKGRRFYGLVQKYNMLITKEEIPLKTGEDVRKIYDELVLAEVTEEDPENAPDGRLFRKGPVSIYSPSQKEIHKGLYPEEKIIHAMDQALQFLEDESCETLYRISIFHYMLEYIHPFYDGNGRLGRFICSYLLSQELEPITGYQLSYTIEENVKEYYQAFSICNDPLNRGDLTPFLYMFLGIIQESVKKLKEFLQKGATRLEHCMDKISEFVPENDDTLGELYSLLIQAALFSEFGVSTNVILKHINISRGTFHAKLAKIPAGFVIKEKRGNTNYYSMNLEKYESETNV